MKKRIKIDSSILSFIIILTGILYQFPQLYAQSLIADDVFDFIGFIIVILGTLLRMVARGYKKEYSKKSQALVTDGPYAIVRNPMYLGSFLMGAGFILIVWPWWSLLLFTPLFCVRFNKQIIKEEDYLQKHFKEDYAHYIHRVPRLVPRIKKVRIKNFKKYFPMGLAWDTKEKWGLLGWFLLAIVLESMQEKIVFGILDIGNAFYVFLLSAVTAALALWLLYRNA